MNRLIIIPDVHGMAYELENLVEKLNVQPEDRVISLGDITDKGPEPVRAARVLMSLGAELTASNHDDRYVRFWRKGKRNASEVAVNSKNKDIIQQQYDQLLKAPGVLDWLASSKPYIKATVNGELLTMVHAGIGPRHDLGRINGKVLNEITRVRYLDDKTYEMVRLVNTAEGYPDEKPNWQPEHNNVIPWQKVYNRRYGVVIHGHNVVDEPTLWLEGEQYTYPVDNANTLDDWDVISLDTGAYKGNKLVALVVMPNSTFHIEEVKCSKSYSD